MTNENKEMTPMVDFAKKDKDAMSWLVGMIGEHAKIYEAKTDRTLATIQKYKDSVYAVVVPAETSEAWWTKRFGNVSSHVYFLKGIEETTKKPLALAIMNYPYQHQSIEDTESIIAELEKDGYNKNMIADALGVQQMSIHRLAKQNGNKNINFAKMLKIRLDLYNFYQSVKQEKQDEALADLKKKK